MSERICDLCGASMMLWRESTERGGDGQLQTSSRSVRWDCTCGRSFVEFQSSASVTIDVGAVADDADD